MNLTATESISVVIAEDREVLRLGQQQMVSAAGDFQVVGTAEDAETLLKVVGIERPRVVVLKDHLPGSLLVPLVKSMRELSPDTVVMIALSCPDAFWTALDTHANGYCLRECPADAFKYALRAVAEGKHFIAPGLAEYLLNGDGLRILQSVSPRTERGPSALDTLSKREKDVIALLSEGHSNEKIAKILGLSIQTVKVHVKHILKKLNVSDRTQAVIKALKS